MLTVAVVLAVVGCVLLALDVYGNVTDNYDHLLPLTPSCGVTTMSKQS